ncbi:MAG TPA: cholesterol oxidase substrate-binding domain-containing protein [Blastocatellia bacterium]|nr:cholesterol oxidase substrate-binding domain-containing protein [Blastocatellia bacterium]
MKCFFNKCNSSRLDEPAGAKTTISTSRRRFLAQTGAIAANAVWLPVFKLRPGNAQTTCPAPPNFPPSIELYQQVYENWANEIRVEDLWTCAPMTPADVVTIANWAFSNGYRIRPHGYMHNWSPLTVTPETTCQTKVVLVDMTQHLTAMRIVPGPSASVNVQTGASMEELLGYLEQAGYGVTAAPAPGDLSVGGVLAINGHGAAVPAQGETRLPGHTYGSLSNLIVSVKAVVWDQSQGQYALRTFDRSDSNCKAFLTHAGRGFITEVTLRVGPNYNLRCVSQVGIPASELFAAPGDGAAHTFASFVESAGRVEAIWFPFTTHPWLKVWSVSPTKPLLSRKVTSPYNYPFSDIIPEEVAILADRIVRGEGSLTPLLGLTAYNLTAAGLIATLSRDIWGQSKNLLLYIRPTTLRGTTNGYAILTRRSDIQRVVSEFVSFYKSRLAAYQSLDRYPINLSLEIRVTGLDQPGDVGVENAEAPVLSAISPRPDHPEWNVAVWVNLLTLPGTPYSNQFYREMETWILHNYSGNYATVRPEWSKGWAYTNDAAWANSAMLNMTIPNLYRAGTGPVWDWAISTLDAFDPHHVFSNPFLDAIFQ